MISTQTDAVSSVDVVENARSGAAVIKADRVQTARVLETRHANS